MWWHKKGKVNIVLKYQKYEEKFLHLANIVAEKIGQFLWVDVQLRKYWHGDTFENRHYLTIIPACQAASTFSALLHSTEGLNTLNVKCFRRTVWETRHSGVNGWELLSHFSDVWCSSLLQLTRSSNWQRESLFRCQMWPHWMYVSNNINT
jgi:hypothetical protein